MISDIFILISMASQVLKETDLFVEETQVKNMIDDTPVRVSWRTIYLRIK